VLAGRGFGKTRCGVEWVREEAETGKSKYVSLIGATADDVRDILVEGESGILATAPKWFRPVYQSSKRRLVWPNGVESRLFTADEPDRLRGKQHHKLLADEVAAWRYPEAWDQAMMGLRLGDNPQAVVTTTPRNTPLIRELMTSPSTALTRGSTYENAGNLAQAFLTEILKKYEGSRLGRQELYAELLDDNPGALWKRATMIDARRVHRKEIPSMRRIVVAIDPAVTVSEESAETGIVVMGLGDDFHAYLLEDLSGKYAPTDWARIAVGAYDRWEANAIVAEVNNGGDLVAANIQAYRANVPTEEVHAARGKATRAEPISTQAEQGRIHHVGTFSQLEDQLCTWEPGQKSPDRLDAYVWAATALLGDRMSGNLFTTEHDVDDRDTQRDDDDDD
jgi:phage terminase large subunit-like protein